MKARKRVVEDETWPVVLRSVRKLHSRVTSRNPRSDFAKLCSSAFGDTDNDVDIESNASNDADSLLHPTPVTQESDLKAEESTREDYEDCEYCQLPRGTARTTFRSVKLGASAGNQCCVTISDAITTWGKHWQCKSGPNPLTEVQPEHVGI